MSTQFSKGLFLRLISPRKSIWRKEVQKIKAFKNLNHIEIWVEELDLLNDEEINWLKKELSDYELIIHAPFINLSIVSSHYGINKASIDVLKKTIDISKKLKAKLITTHAGAYPLFLNEDNVRKKFIKNFKEIIKYSANEIPITIENISMRKSTQISYPVLLNELSKIKQEIPEIKFTIDIGHCVQNNDNFSDFLVENVDSIKNIHLHNATKKEKAHYGFQKDGDLDSDNFLRLLEKIRYSGFLSLEILEKEDIEKSWKILNNKLYN